MDNNSIAMQWFRRTFGAPTSVQEPAWREISNGASTLVSAPTGTGKTLAAFLVFIEELGRRAREGRLRDELYLIYVSPLKSLAGDIRENLKRPLDGIAALERELEIENGTSGINVAVRTGDTTSTERRRMVKKPPHILITTPESLYLMLTSESGREMLRTARALIIDELHALINTKRGAHMMLSAARLDRLCGSPLQRIGLSATVTPLEAAAEYLSPDDAVIVAPPQEKKTEITVVSPFPENGILPQNTVWPELARVVVELCADARTAIAFCESRRQTEKLVYHIEELISEQRTVDEYTGADRLSGAEGAEETSRKRFTFDERSPGDAQELEEGGAFFGRKRFTFDEKSPGDAQELEEGGAFFGRKRFTFATHHGSISKERRALVEDQLRSGELNLLIATSSMELGIDVGDIDLVLQIGCPRGIASALQRLGRAGHAPGKTSVMRIIPRTSGEGLYCALTAVAASEGKIERSHPPRLCFDVLAQHLTSMAAAEQFKASDVLAVTKRAYPFREVTPADVESVLKMLAGDYEHRRDIPVHPRVNYDRINGTVSGDNYTRLLALSAGGTIPDRGLFKVKAESGVILGEVDEEFTFEARVGDKFLLGSFAWQIKNVTKDTIYVTPTSLAGSRPPFWKGDWDGRDYETGLAFGTRLRDIMGSEDRVRALKELGMDADSAIRAADYILAQETATGLLPDDRTIVAEHFTDDTGIGQLMIHSLFGRRVNAPLAMLAREAVRRTAGMDIGVFDDDDGLLLFPYSEGGIPEGVLQEIDIGSAESVLAGVLPETPLFSMSFRYNAARAMMMGVKSRSRTPLWVQRMRGAELLEAVIQYPEHPLIRETKRECLEDYWDIENALDVLRRIKSGEIHVREIFTEVPSPFSLPLRRAAEAELMYEYSPTPAGVHQAVADARGEELLPPSEARLDDVTAPSPPPRDTEELHTRLMIEGEALAGEISAPHDWFEKLAREKRIKYIEPGFWIAAEHEEEYGRALDEGDFDARFRLVRRALRYRGGMDAGTVAERFFWSTDETMQILKSLEQAEQVICSGEVYYHADLYERARRATVQDRRRAVVTVPPERYADLKLRRRTVTAPPEEQLVQSLLRLSGRAFTPDVWESIILPARVRGYRAELLDKVLSNGEIFWQYHDDGGISFHPYDDIDFDAPLPETDNLSEGEAAVLQFLRTRGASFSRTLPAPKDGTLSDVLFSLIRRGLVRSDSFLPVRRLGDKPPRSEAEVKRIARARSAALTGRFEAVRMLRELPIEEKLHRIMEREDILCRETARGVVDWGMALEHLSLWELTGRARRGYFVEGLSGAQFIDAAEAEATILALGTQRADVTWISAVDPALAWGKTLKHLDGRSFTAVAGTAVALRGGLPVAVFERRGAVLRLFEGADAELLLREFTREFSLGTVFSDAKRVTVREYPREAAGALKEAGFSMQMNDYVLYRSSI